MSLLIPTPAARVRPRWWIGVAVFVALQLVIIPLVPSLGHGQPGQDPAALGYLVGSIGINFVLAITLISVFGWWRPVLFEASRPRRLWLFAPAVPVLGALLVIGFSGIPKPLLFVSSVLLFLVAATVEELVLRGILITGLRGSRLPEWSVYVVSTLLFAFMHLGNVANGTSFADAFSQSISAVLLGSLLYLVRRVSGSLVVAIIVHFFSNLAVTSVNAAALAAPLGNIGGYLVQFSFFLAVPLVIVLLILDARKARRDAGSEV